MSLKSFPRGTSHPDRYVQTWLYHMPKHYDSTPTVQVETLNVLNWLTLECITCSLLKREDPEIIAYFPFLFSVTPPIKTEYRVNLRNDHILRGGNYLVFVWTYIILVYIYDISQLGSLPVIWRWTNSCVRHKERLDPVYVLLVCSVLLLV